MWTNVGIVEGKGGVLTQVERFSRNFNASSPLTREENDILNKSKVFGNCAVKILPRPPPPRFYFRAILKVDLLSFLLLIAFCRFNEHRSTIRNIVYHCVRIYCVQKVGCFH